MTVVPVDVSGLLVSYCYGFDLKVGSKKIYYIASVIGESLFR